MTGRRPYSLDVGPTGPLFRALLEFALRPCSSALVVVRPGESLEASGQAFIKELGALEIACEERSEWPGTILLDEKAAVYTFRFNPTTVELILRFSDGLYDWQHPALPEDLCLLRDDGAPWLLSIAHEYDAALLLDESEFNLLERSNPNIAVLLHADGVG